VLEIGCGTGLVLFRVAPAVLGFTLGLRGGWDMLILTYFVVCGVSRLARFNATAADLSNPTTGRPLRRAAEGCSPTVSDTVGTWSRRIRRARGVSVGRVVRRCRSR